MNIAEILKDAPKGTKLYSPLFGDVTLLSATNASIRVASKDGFERCFTQYGKMCLFFSEHEVVETETVLFPSKENRDWSTFNHKATSQFPTTYEECCVALNPSFKECKYKFLLGATDGFGKIVDCTYKSSYFSELNALHKLLICRDAWWKVDNNWKPDWEDKEQNKYYISSYNNQFRNCYCNSFNRILVFRTKELRDKFFETFRELIEQCKELI